MAVKVMDLLLGSLFFSDLSPSRAIKLPLKCNSYLFHTTKGRLHGTHLARTALRD